MTIVLCFVYNFVRVSLVVEGCPACGSALDVSSGCLQ